MSPLAVKLFPGQLRGAFLSDGRAILLAFLPLVFLHSVPGHFVGRWEGSLMECFVVRCPVFAIVLSCVGDDEAGWLYESLSVDD